MMESNTDPQSPSPLAHRALDNLRKRLLDLTSRNRLIHFQHRNNSSLRIVDELPNQLVEQLLSEQEMRFQAIPEPSEEELIAAGFCQRDDATQPPRPLRPPPSAQEWARYLNLACSYEMPSIADPYSRRHADHSMRALLFAYELEARLKSLQQLAESAVQEMGANILYLALGFLEWFESAHSDMPRHAPLFLVPVRLRRGRLNPATRMYEYTLAYSGEDIIANLSLREKLRTDFAMALPELDAATAPEDYFASVTALIGERQPRWQVRRHVSLVLLNFSKQLMYLDLDPQRWPANASLVEHPVVSQFLAGGNADGADDEAAASDGTGSGFQSEYGIDNVADVHHRYPLIDDADSSQHSALMDAVDGKNLVIEGPPGTGKSQTITNLIAAAMAQGKKVLFVAEKLAALEVVRRRLDRAGLGDFCLELHSHTSQKRQVLDAVQQRLQQHGQYRNPATIEVEIARYEEHKNALQRHALRLNSPWKHTGLSAHDIFMAATRHRQDCPVPPETLHPEGYDGHRYDPATLRRHRDQAGNYGKVYQTVAQQLGEAMQLQEHPWYGVRNGDLQIFDSQRVRQSLEQWQHSLQTLYAECSALHQRLQLPGGHPDVAPAEPLADTLEAAHGLHTVLRQLPTLAGDELLDQLPLLHGEELLRLQRSLTLLEDIQSRFAALAPVVGAAILQDLSAVSPMLEGRAALQGMVGEDVELGRLGSAVHRLGQLEERLAPLQEPLQGLQDSLGAAASPHLGLHQAGLQEFQTAIELIASLPAAHWKHRDPCFDNDELDSLLPRLEDELRQTWQLRETLQTRFALELVPDAAAVRQLASTLAAGGLLRWLQSGWRAARQQLRSYAATPQITLAELQAHLAELAEFSEQRQRLRQHNPYAQALGTHWQGLETDIDTLQSLRHWYRRVRQHYGLGFGKKVALGEAIVQLPASMAQAVRSLADRQIPAQLDGLMDELHQLQAIFAPSPRLHEPHSALIGPEGLLATLRHDIRQAIEQCGPLATDTSLPLAELARRIERLGLLQQRVELWHKATQARPLLAQRLNLRIGLGADNQAGITALRHTLALAQALHHPAQATTVPQQAVLAHLCAQPQAQTFAALAAHAQRLGAALATEQQQAAAFAQAVQLDAHAWRVQCGDHLPALLTRNQRALDHSKALQDWLAYVRERDQLDRLGLGRLADSVEQHQLDVAHIVPACQAGIFDLLAREILREDPELGRFSGHSQEALQQRFREYDNRLKQLQCEQIAWQIDQNPVPAGNQSARVAERSERALLELECAKKTRHIPIRQLIDRAGNALTALKPCFMMGPMAVAQYLTPGKIGFDLVVMDEASQIKPQDALGAIARGRQLVVVGDPKQLPPTSFFDRLSDDEPEDEENGITALEESESILDATLPIFPARRLRWHYRSQHESLIAFSNQAFYNDNLILFPSPHQRDANYGIHFTRVPDGCFQSRRNLAEARTIAHAVQQHLMQRPHESLGVVAMNTQQRQHIEHAIDMLARDDALLRDRLEHDANQHEGLFIKNLENVQGDERDVIFISMTYGPQEPGGRVPQRFGPINADVGWRRLNVLFTRSRKRMQIFSSMGSHDIVIGPQSKLGVQALRDFLAFCETGILHQTRHASGRAPDSDFEIAVMRALREEGFECVPQVGVTGFFIDLAVIDPDNPGHYLMGIECDGATYHSSKSVRDRDRLRQTILERLGWRIRRIWSTDWFKNPQGTLAPIIRELHNLRTAPPSP